MSSTAQRYEAGQKRIYLYCNAGTEFMGGRGDMSPQLLDSLGHTIFCPPQHFVIKSNVFVQISWLHYCCKRFPSLKPGNN